MLRQPFPLLLLLLLNWNPILCQKPEQIDSLKKELSLAKEDSTRIRLRYWIGYKSKISRVGFWDSIIKDAHKLGETCSEGKACNMMGRYLRLNGKWDQSVAFFEESIRLAEREGHLSEMLQPLSNLAHHYYGTNEIKKALDLCFKGLGIAERINDKKMTAKLYDEIGSCYFSTGEMHKALNAHKTSLKISKEIQDHLGIWMALGGVGADYLALKDTQNTIVNYLAVKRYVNEFKEGFYGVDVHNIVGAGYGFMRQFDSAKVYCGKALKIARQMDQKETIISVLVAIADIHYQEGDLSNSKKTALEAFDLLKTVYFPVQIPHLSLLLKDIYIKEGNFEKALKMQEVYSTAKDTLASENIRRQGIQKEYSYNLEKKESQNKLLAQQNQIQSMQLSQNRILAICLGILLFLVLLTTFLFIRQNRLKVTQQSTELEHKLLRSQMNPHFIFNSLQAIQNFILKRDEKEAVKYLSSFATVARNVLENSRMEFIPLKKELILLKNYLQLQKLRFADRFDYEIFVDPTINCEHVNIPPMLAQPFLENAVEHGMHDVERDGKITVSFTMLPRILLMEISDNGSGIKNQTQVKQSHRSLAMEITKERLQLINRKASRKAFYTVSEAFPHETERKGVKISFVLPSDLAT